MYGTVKYCDGKAMLSHATQRGGKTEWCFVLLSDARQRLSMVCLSMAMRRNGKAKQGNATCRNSKAPSSSVKWRNGTVWIGRA